MDNLGCNICLSIKTFNVVSNIAFLNGLQTTSLRTDQEHFSLKIWEKLRTASLDLNFTGSNKKNSVLSPKKVMENAMTPGY